MAGPFIVPIADLRRRVGTRRELRRAVEVSTAEWPESVAGTTVPGDGQIQLDLVLESVLEGLTVTGTLRAPWRADCRRCLEPVEGEIEVDVQEVFEANPIGGETYPLEGDQIDLEPLVRDAVLLALPLSALCAQECAGPDPERFPAEVGPVLDPGAGPERPFRAEEVEPAPVADPRWTALGDLRFNE